jgi:cyclopropane fatty-acyl-phospholipid synthase-like methyltransferase
MIVANGLQVPPASARNAAPILAVLRRVLAGRTAVLEIASGSGYHAATFASGLAHLTWQPSDADPEALASIAAHVAAIGLPNLRDPVTLDVCSPTWPEADADAVVCINMIHISPWEATLGLFAGAKRLMPADGVVVTYGPYSIAGDFLAESNIAFDQSLKQRNPAWGIREVGDVAGAAAENGFRHEETVRMPANNLILIFKG